MNHNNSPQTLEEWKELAEKLYEVIEQKDLMIKELLIKLKENKNE